VTETGESHAHASSPAQQGHMRRLLAGAVPGNGIVLPVVALSTAVQAVSSTGVTRANEVCMRLTVWWCRTARL